MHSSRTQIAESLHTASRLAVVLLGFSIAVSTSLASALAVVIAFLWLVGGDLPVKLRRIAANPAAWLPLALFVWLIIGAIYTSIDPIESLRGASKYRELLYIPILLTLVPGPNARLGRIADVVDALRRRQWNAVDHRTWSVAGFVAGALCELAASYGEWLFGVDWGFPSTTDHVVFKDRIIHNFLLAYVLFVLAHDAHGNTRRRWRIGAAILGAATVVNMLALVHGRTGYLAVVVLTATFMFQRFGGRGVVYAAASLAVLACIAYAGSATFRFRVQETLLQVQTSLGRDVQPADDRMTAEEPRLRFYGQALELVRRRPIAGGGAGSFGYELRRLVDDPTVNTTDDPHNEFLAIAAQSGLVGLALWLAILVIQWKKFQGLELPDRHLAHGLLVLMISGCLVNSLLLGFTGGLFWAYFSALLAPLPLSEERSAKTDVVSTVTRGCSSHQGRIAA
jgi:hypothetical protein